MPPKRAATSSTPTAGSANGPPAAKKTRGGKSPRKTEEAVYLIYQKAAEMRQDALLSLTFALMFDKVESAEVAS